MGVTSRAVDVDQAAGVLTLNPWRGDFASLSARELAREAVEVLDRVFGDVEPSSPILVRGVSLLVATGSASDGPRVLAELRLRAVRDDVDGQVVLATGGAGVAIPALVGGKPCVVVHIRAHRSPSLR